MQVGHLRLTLIFPVPTLNLFVFTFLNFAFEDAGALWFVETCHLENLRSVKPRIRPPTHDCDAFTHPAKAIRLRIRALSLSAKLTAHRQGFHCTWPV